MVDMKLCMQIGDTCFRIPLDDNGAINIVCHFRM